DTDTLLRHMLLQTLSSTPANVGAVLLRESGDRLVVRATHPASAGGTLPQEAYSAALAALRVGEAQYLSTAAGTLACLPLDDASPDGPPRAPLGVLLVGNPHPNAFGARDRDLFAYLATQATALIRRQQVADAERALRSVAGLSVPRAQVLERVPVLIGQALNATVCLVHVLDRRQDRYVLAGLAGLNASEPALQHLDLAGADPGLTALFSASLDQLAAPDGPGARLWAPAVLAGAGLRYSLAVPFRVDGRPFGILSLHSFDGRPPSVGAPRALAALAADLGVVLEGLRQQEQLETLTTLGADLVSASDPQYASVMPAPAGATATALTRLLASAADLVAARAAYLLLRSEETPGLRVHAVSGAATLAPGALLPPTAGTLLAITTPRYLADVPTPRPPGHMTFDVATRSSAILPLMSGSTAGSAVLGVLVVESPTPQAISEEDYRVLQAVAALAAGLLIQHGLVQQLRTQPVQVQRILDTLAPVLGESDRPQAYLDLVAHARETLGADLVVLHPWDGEGPFQVVPPQSGNQQAGALAGSPAMQTLARQVLHDPAGRAAGPLFVGDMRAFQGSELPEWMAAEGVQALSIAPLVSGDAIFGVLFVAYRQPHLFGQSEKEAVRLFASVATLVLKDAGLAMGTRSLGDAQPNAQSDAVAAQMQSLSMAAHELREPVDKVHMIIETALNGLWLPMSDTLRDRLSVAYKLLDDHYDALGRILQLGRLQTGHQDLTREPVVLADLVQAVIGRHAELARTQDVRLEAALDPLLTLQRPQLDVVLMEVVLSNLVHNALKFSPGGSKVTLLCTSTYVERQRRLVYTVTDEGPGIPADQVDRIFEPYFQADNSLGRTGGGMGLGLTLARLVVELHGGSLSVESIPGRGSRFMVQLPFLTA
ncbi:MAG TPA: ATP-binding protein, partial [Chloroflexia bacterium]|nr:ATP-binding protein [Chloroflexia bacterium]